MPNHQFLDCCLYNNEVELLELRYHVLKRHVDKFIVCEANQTFRGQPREPRAVRDIQDLGLDLARFDVITVDVSAASNMITNQDLLDAQEAGAQDMAVVWARQRLQRDSVLSRFTNYARSMTWILGDIDEIPRPDCLDFVADMLHQHPNYVLKLPLVLLERRADLQLQDPQGNPVWWDRSLLMCRGEQLLQATPSQMRSERITEYRVGHAVQDNQRVNGMGWHFTWMGKSQDRSKKLDSCAHGVNPSSINNISADTAADLSQHIGQKFVPKKSFVSQPYDIKQLPSEIWQLPRVRDYLLPEQSRGDASALNLVARVLSAGGSIAPLLVPSDLTNGTGLFNPSVLVDGQDIMINVRHCQYSLFHAEQRRFEHEWGPLLYLHPENDCTLTTTNYLGRLDPQLNLESVQAVDTSALDTKPLWEFVGLEDVRMVKWQQKMYYCGVRRDTTTNGQGRMELSEIDVTGSVPREVSRRRMPAPGSNDSYCEKNWMPVLDQPYTFVKWCNPTEVVRYDPGSGTTQQVFLGQYQYLPYDLRGGSQVLTLGDYRVAITHMAYLDRSASGRKDGTYRHVVVIWDREWRVVKYGSPFSFMDARIEFCCGMAESGPHILMTFGIQDNAAYVLQIPREFFMRWIHE